jgi:hypothetical protein
MNKIEEFQDKLYTLLATVIKLSHALTKAYTDER